MKLRKLLHKSMNAPQNVRFADLCTLAGAFGYHLDRVSGSHHIFVNPKTTRPLNIQKRLRQGQAVSGEAVLARH